MKTYHLAELKDRSASSMKDKSTQGVSSARRTSVVGIPVLPLEWTDSATWRLPSGKAVAEFALQAGFLAPQLFQLERGMGRGRELRRDGRISKVGLR
jgi:hypothetical protein